MPPIAPEIQTVVDGAVAAFGKKLDDFNAEQKAKVDELVNAAIAKLNAEWAAKSLVHSLPGSSEERYKGQKYSFGRAQAAVANNDPSMAPMEWAMSEELRKTGKAMSFATDTAGGFLVPNEVMRSEMIPLLYAEAVCTQLGARQLSGLTRAPIQIPRVGGGTTAYWVGEAVAGTASDMALQQMTLTPHGIMALTIVSDLLQNLDAPGVEEMIRQDMAMALGLKIDLAAMAGSHNNGQPDGLLTAGTCNTTTVSDPATYNQLLAVINEVRVDNALKGKLGWACSSADMLEFEQIVDTDSGGTNTRSQTFERRRMLSEDGTKLMGYPIKVSTQLTDGQIIFGNWADLVIAQWGGMRFDMTNAVSFTSAQSHLRMLTYADIGIRNPASFCIPA